jgi:arylsulfatase
VESDAGDDGDRISGRGMDARDGGRFGRDARFEVVLRFVVIAAGAPEWRDGVDLLNGPPREYLFGYYGVPGTPQYKVMVRHGDWKYIYLANGGREQLFDLRSDPHELKNVAGQQRETANRMRAQVVRTTNRPALRAAMNGNDVKAFPFTPRPMGRIYQFDRSRGITGFPKHPQDVLARWRG